MIDYQEIGNNIKICRIRCNLKQAELAEMVGVTSQHISHVERCQTKPSLTLLVDISTALRVDLYTLLGSNIPVHRRIFGGGGHWGNIRRRPTVMYRREENIK